MKIKFKVQAHQTAAVQAVVDCFHGQPLLAGGYAVATTASLFARDLYANAPLQLAPSALLENLAQVQQRQQLPLSDSLVQDAVSPVNLDIEMETGTGKTYCYLKTLFELNRLYGWSKFIIVVPSIAIREGVAKSLEMTAEHFLETYHKKARFFIYDSRQLHHLESFAADAGINVMVINVQAFAARGTENRRIYEVLDDFQSRRPIDVLSAIRPILILDEPQRMEGAQTLKSLEAFKALMVLRYSATHKRQHNLVHRLDALDAYNQKLVKKIAVRGISLRGQSGANGYLYLQSVEVSAERAPQARTEFEQKLKGGHIRRVLRKLKRGDDLFELSNGLETYRGHVVADVDAGRDSLAFTNGVELFAGEAVGDVDEQLLRRIQIREAIKAHFDKEQRLFPQGIKVLTLFFIDEVAKYRDYARDDEKGEYARVFEEEYWQYVQEEGLGLANGDYGRYLQGIQAAGTHSGYFSIDRKTRRLADPQVEKRGENAGLSNDADAYDLILKDKERLLSLDEPVRFVFSHSALREGWDNPNVFVICLLKHSDNNLSRRQEVGRGLRLAVDQAGERMDDPAHVHEINVLTVVANESYQAFVSALQQDIRDSLSSRPLRANQATALEIEDERRSRLNLLTARFGAAPFQALWQGINFRATYQVRFDSDELVRRAVQALDQQLRVTSMQYSVQRGEQNASIERDDLADADAFVLQATQVAAVRPSPRAPVKHDLIGKVAAATQLTRRTTLTILQGIAQATFEQLRRNPEQFMAQVARLVNEQKALLVADSLVYALTGERYADSVFQQGQLRLEAGQAGPRLERHVYQHVGADSQVEQAFVRQLDSCEQVAVYAKLPRGFLIPTPVGGYTPDWAIALTDGRHLVVETKGSASMMDLSAVERTKISCAERFFAAINAARPENPVRYLVVNDFQGLLDSIS